MPVAPQKLEQNLSEVTLVAKGRTPCVKHKQLERVDLYKQETGR